MKIKNIPSTSADKIATNDLETRLRAYSSASVAALATTAVALGAAATASGQIVNITSVSGVTAETWTGNGSGTHAGVFSFDVGGNAAKFGFQIGYFASNHTGVARLQVASNLASIRHLNLATVGGASQYALTKFGLDAVIAAPFYNGGYFMTALKTQGGAGTFARGQFHAAIGAPATGYVGFRMKNGTHASYDYGWLRLKVTVGSNGRADSISVIPLADTGIYGAYQTGGINAGQTAAVPEPTNLTGLALLALGAVGVREARRRRKQAA
jgi:hypothetical protein